MKRVIRLVLAVACLVLVAAEPEGAGRRAGRPQQPITAVVEKADKTRLAGKITAFDADGFTLVNDRNQTHEVRWSEIPAKNVFPLYGRLIEKNNDPAQWIELGGMLQEMEGGKEWAERAYARAMRIDPSQKERIAEMRTSAGQPKGAPTTKPGSGAAGPADGAGAEGLAAGPQTVGQVEEQFWGKLPEDQMKKAVAELTAFGDKTIERINGNLQFFETKFFLFYSDLPDDEAHQWAILLDRMYARLCELFGVPLETNIWRGKCLIFVFAEEADYLQFQRVMHHTDAFGSAGMCHNFGDGAVHIAFYRQPDELDFAHVLVHESVHGFLHRYRKPPHVPSWVNEGLAEVIAAELVPNDEMQQKHTLYARLGIEKMGGIDDGFFHGRIQAWHYPVARTLTEFMILENKQGYVDFVNGIKDGMDWEEALEQKYGTDTERLVDFYYDWLGVQRKLLR